MFQWKCWSPLQISWCVMASFSMVSQGSQFCQKKISIMSLSDVSFCCYRNDTGKLWQILRTSGGERRNLWKMPSSLVSKATQSCVCCSSLPGAHNADLQLFSPLCSAFVCHQVWHDVWPGLLVAECRSSLSCQCYFTVLWTFLNKTGLVVVLAWWKLQVLLCAENWLSQDVVLWVFIKLWSPLLY